MMKKRLAFASALALTLVGTAACAQTTVFTFPDPAIVSFRLTTATINFNGGTQPWIRIAAPVEAGHQVHVTGQLALSGGYVRLIGCGETSANTFSGTDAIDDTITCSAQADYVTIIGQSNLTVGTITALSVEITPAP